MKIGPLGKLPVNRDVVSQLKFVSIYEIFAGCGFCRMTLPIGNLREPQCYMMRALAKLSTAG